ncbi:hypothetical protein E2C01_090487 [Portunus trituberculatus]|uniref:Uncharacterized protein n=1 Tax=Portunus trituberculatus TaxID=210409 RepID=A0A5B7JL06_PORTR|nr:hypothetical protein [Portunus trituberculatus]
MMGCPPRGAQHEAIHCVPGCSCGVCCVSWPVRAAGGAVRRDGV